MKSMPACFTINKLALILTVLAVIAFAACGTEQAVVDDPVPIPVPVIVPEPIPIPVPEPVVVQEPEIVQEEEPFIPLIEMISIRGGSFLMGSPERRDIERRENPVHEVTVRSFSMGKYEVTQGQYVEVFGESPRRFNDTNPEDAGPDGWMKLPVEGVNWYDTLVFCNKLSIEEGLDPVYSINGSVNPDDWGDPPQARRAEWDEARMIIGANGYRLPTEAEWEYAARGGSDSNGYTYAGTDSAFPDDVAWYDRNAENRSHETGKKAPNELGLHDMSGNVMEWCWDWFEESYYSNSSADNPIGLSTEEIRRQQRQPTRVLRGGSHGYRRDFARVAYRHFNEPQSRYLGIGFRVARWE